MSLRVDMSSADQTKTTIRRYIDEFFNKGNLAAADELVAEDFVDHTAWPGQPPGREGVKQGRAMISVAFPDLQYIVEDMVTAGDKVWVRSTWRATHQGAFMGVPPTGRLITWTAQTIVRIENGQLVEHWGVSDQVGMMRQLGVIPDFGPPPGPQG